MTAIRSVHAAEGKFVQISNAAMQDRHLSLSARGLLAYVLSLPPDKAFSAAWLEKQVPDGRREIRSALRELEACGYCRRTKTSAGGTWVWDQVISDAPLSADDEQPASSQVSPCDRNRSNDTTCQDSTSAQVNASDRFVSDANRPNKDLNTQPPNTEDPEKTMASRQASRRARTSGASAPRTIDRVIRDIRQAIIQVHGQQEADELSDNEVLGLYAVYANRGGITDLVAYMTRILGDAPYLDTFMSNVEPVCRQCRHWESKCKCPAESAA